MRDFDITLKNIDNPSLRRAYSLLERRAPLGKGDCGRLCDGQCCKGADGEGMWLFPHEKELFEKAQNFTVCDCEANSGYPMLVCRGRCNRRMRPLACRIFPLFPMVYEDGGVFRLEVVRDPRAASCPLNRCGIRLDNAFVRSVRLAGKALMQDDAMLKYILDTSALLADIISLREQLRGELTSGEIYNV